MTKDETLQMCLEYIETDAHERKYVRHAIKQALAAPVQEPVAKDNSNYRLDPPGLDLADGTQVSKVWWDGEKLMAKPIPLVDFYQPVQDSTCNETLRAQGKAYPRTCRKCGLGPCIGAPKQLPTQPATEESSATQPAQPAPVREPVTEAQIQTLAECEQENRLLKARVDRMQREFALERQRLLDENTEIYGLLGMAHLNLKQHLEYGFNPNTAKSTLISVGRYAPKVREAMNGWKENKPTPRQWVGLTDEEKRNICRFGPVYAPDGVVTRRPLEYRKELEGVALMAVRKAEAKLKEKNT